MSSREFPSTCGKTGIFDADGGKAGATIAASSRVYIPYCSSDGWMGDAAFASAAEIDAIRGFTLTRHDTRRIKVESGQHITISPKGGRKSLLLEVHTGRTRRGKRGGEAESAYGFNPLAKNASKDDYTDPNLVSVETVGKGGCPCVVM